jgi:hypothetical protein
MFQQWYAAYQPVAKEVVPAILRVCPRQIFDKSKSKILIPYYARLTGFGRPSVPEQLQMTHRLQNSQ